MAIKIGNLDINAFKLGSGDTTIYLGDTLLYPTTPPTPSFDGKWLATYSDSHVESAECDSSSEISYGEINGTNLVSVEIGDCVTSIGSNAFDNCGFTSIDIPNSVTSIGGYAFQNCGSLTSCIIGDGVTSIGELAFIGCTSLTSITIPDSVTSIGAMAFYSCSSLTSITVNATTPPTLEGFGLWFDNTNNCPIYVPSASLTAYQTAWPQYASRIQALP